MIAMTMRRERGAKEVSTFPSPQGASSGTERGNKNSNCVGP